MQKFYFTIIFLFYMVGTIYSRNYTVSGYVSASGSGETLINATIFDQKTGSGAVSNSYGFYSLTLPSGAVELSYSFVGLISGQRHFNLKADTVINISLDEKANLKEITVLGMREGLDIRSPQMSAINIPVSQLKNVPALLGETYIIKALQLLPGVKSGSEGSSGMYVRGGGPDENLLILDGIPVYNANHLLGFFSVFNADAIKDVTLYKGNFPARFGGRLSSVVDIRMNDGNNKQIHGNVSIGLISSKINIEGPVASEKTTFNISARRTYADILAQPFFGRYAASQNGGAKGSSFGYYFYDLNGKVSHKISDNDRLYLSAYYGDDVVYGDMQQYKYEYNDSEVETGRLNLDWNWGNLISALRWNHVVSNKLFMNTTASYTRYRFDMIKGTDVTTESKSPMHTTTDKRTLGFKSGISDYATKVDFDWSPNPAHDIKFGANYTYHSFRPGVTVLSQSAGDTIVQKMDTTYGDKAINSAEMYVYFEDNIILNRILELNVGLHYSSLYVQNHLYNLWPQPRLGLRVLVNDRLSVKAAFASMNQYVHLLSNSNISLPTDLWVPVTRRIPPMHSAQYSAGVFYNSQNKVNLSVEAYYKSMNNLIEYKDGASFLGSDTGWEDKVNIGRGWAYGIEFLAQKTIGKTTGWIGYTWSVTERLFDREGQKINNGNVFPAKYDRPHSISIVAMHKFSDKMDIAATWVYSSGNRGTLALHYFDGTQPPQSELRNGQNNILPYISSRNNYKYPANHRLDVGINFHKQKKHGIRTWNVSVYNVYDHQNPFLVTITDDSFYNFDINKTSYRKHLTRVTLFPIIPSVSYTYKF